MWRHKTESEKAAEEAALRQRRKRLGWPAFWAVCLALLITSARAIGLRGKHSPTRDPLSWDQVVREVPVETAIIFPFCFGILVYSFRKGEWDNSDKRMRMCPGCHRVQYPNEQGCTHCGRALEPFADWHWTGNP